MAGNGCSEWCENERILNKGVIGEDICWRDEARDSTGDGKRIGAIVRDEIEESVEFLERDEIGV